MDFEPSARARELGQAPSAFMDERVLPVEGAYEQQRRDAGDGFLVAACAWPTARTRSTW